jgi:hypothetical protein
VRTEQTNRQRPSRIYLGFVADGRAQGIALGGLARSDPSHLARQASRLPNIGATLNVQPDPGL